MSGQELELLDDDPTQWRSRHRQRLFVAQRVGWAVFALIGLAALAGVFGPGPLSAVDRSDPSGLVGLSYERFVRNIGDTTLELRLQPDPAAPGSARVWLSGEYLAAVQVQQVQPEPESWAGGPGGVVLTFPVTGTSTLSVQIQLRPAQIGLVRGVVGVPGRTPVPFWQFVYP